MFAQTPNALSCPRCGTPVTAEVHNLIDVQQNPELKAAFLLGQLNTATCPNCGTEFTIATPTLYHDAEKEFLGLFLPPSPRETELEQQRRIGSLTTSLMNRLPPEKRKAYLLQPKQFLSLQSMIDAILELDGISPEMMRAQRERIQLMQDILRAAGNAEQVRSLVEQHRDVIDETFFEMMIATVNQAAAEGQQAVAQQLAGLTQFVMSLTDTGRRILAQQQVLSQLNENTTREDVLRMLVEAEDEAVVELLVAYARPLMDYYFFQLLADRIDKARQEGKKDEADRLSQLRERVLELQRQQDQVLRQVMENATRLLETLMASDDPAATIQAHKDEIDQAFLSVLTSNIQMARRQGAVKAAQKLQQIMNLALEVLEEDLPPDVRLINRLLRADYPEGTRQIIREHRSELNPQLVETMRQMAQSLRDEGQTELAKRLDDIRAQVSLML